MRRVRRARRVRVSARVFRETVGRVLLRLFVLKRDLPSYRRGLRGEVKGPASLNQRRWLQVSAALGQGPQR